MKNLDLDYKVVVGGSEAALLQSFRSAQENKTPLLAYFYTPQWYAEVNGEPPRGRRPGPDRPRGAAALRPRAATPTRRRWPATTRRTHLNKLISTEFAESGSPAVDLVKNFEWTNEDQNLVSSYIAQDSMTPDDAAKKWIEENQDKVDAWLELTVATRDRPSSRRRCPARGLTARLGPERMLVAVSL